MTIIETKDVIALGNAQLDEDHKQFMLLLNTLDASENRDFPRLFQNLYEHTKAHFEYENALMDQYAFPAISEHQRVLAEFKQFKKRIDKGLIAFGRSFAKERLPQWFELHVSTMDSALVAHIKRQT